MSTVKADNFTWKSGQSGGLSGTNVTGDQIVYGVVKSWISFNTTTTTTVKQSYNVSTLTDNGTGNTTIGFTNSFVDANYAYASGTKNGFGALYLFSTTVSAITVVNQTVTGPAAVDGDYQSVIINR